MKISKSLVLHCFFDDPLYFPGRKTPDWMIIENTLRYQVIKNGDVSE